MASGWQLDIVLACFEVTDKDSLLRLLYELEHFEVQDKATCLLVGTKLDKAGEMAESFEIVRQLAEVNNCVLVS